MRSYLLPALAGALCLLASTANAATTGAAGGGAPIDNRQPSLVMEQLIALNGIFPCRDCPGATAAHTMGEVRTFAGNFNAYGAPRANGQVLPINQDTALFSLLDTTYGGNGTTTYGLPDLRARAVVGAGAGPGLSPYALGQQSGSDQTVLTLGNLAAHDHDLSGGGVTGVTGSNAPFDNRQPTLALNYEIAANGLQAAGDPFVGQIGQFATNFEVGGWLNADGRLVNIADYPELFNTIGTIYGGDGTTTFQLPDLRGRMAVGAGADGLTIGDAFGQEQTILTDANLPAHDHSLPGGGFTGLDGGGLAYDNAQPSLAINYLIDVAGLFPPHEGSGGLPAEGDPFLGEIVGFAGTIAPHGWMFADGTLLHISQATALFSLLGTLYGGDGITTFALPDLRGRSILGEGDGLVVGDVVGNRFNTISIGQMPSHDHSLPDAGGGGGGVPEPAAWALMIAGFGLAGASLRRRRAAAA